jgi:hypothetical protein
MIEAPVVEQPPERLETQSSLPDVLVPVDEPGDEERNVRALKRLVKKRD